MFCTSNLLDLSISRHLKFWEWSDFIHNLTTGRKIKRLIKLIDDFIKSATQEKKKQYLSGNKDDVKGKRKAFMDLLLELQFETQELSEKDIRDEVNTFIGAGYETVSVTITWALYLIGLHPDIQEKIHDELDRIFGSDVDRDITESDLNDLKYLDCVLKESQRLYSAVPMVTRTLQEDCNICGYSLPKGSTCVILLYFLHKDKEVFPDPEKFDPDRFLPENAVNIPECGFIPFSAGLRNCIGNKITQ
ncbi:cytochrome P450 4c3 [Trichonephila clavata]|uniref:Cytochrome P450 4c3 n=1 Tax=Trichonephila clavata TaxID=2740835 RepID=A0A8X6HKN1_TRICU|nr:cytochrome P450 4c3 [Trichonephila clavata]